MSNDTALKPNPPQRVQPPKFLEILCGYGVAVITIAVWADRNGTLLDSYVPAGIAVLTALVLAAFKGLWAEPARKQLESSGVGATSYYVTLAAVSFASSAAGIALWVRCIG